MRPTRRMPTWTSSRPSTSRRLSAEPDASFPSDWETQLAAWPSPKPDDTFLLIYTSGTTGTPKGVTLAHDNVLAGVASFQQVIPPMDHRIVSLLPLSHLFEQSVGLMFALSLGADILYVRSRNPRVIFEAIRDHRTTSMVVVPQVLDLFWSAIEREVEKSGRQARSPGFGAIARHLPMGAAAGAVPARPRPARRRVAPHGLGRSVPAAGVQQAWEDLGVLVIQGYGATETGSGTATTPADHGLGTVGRPLPGVEMRLAEDGEVQFRGHRCTRGYWQDPEATAAAFTADGWYKTGDLGHLDAARPPRSCPGRKRDMIVLPNGFNVFPEDIENALRVAGIRDSVVLETEPGRIEAVVLAPAGPGVPAGGRSRRSPGPSATPTKTSERPRRGSTPRSRRPTRRWPSMPRIAAWRFWPDEDFPRTHTLKIKRDQVRAWAAVAAPLPVTEGG